MNKNLGPKILALREEGKSYNEIVKLTGASKSTICYHCGDGQKHKTLQRKSQHRINKPLSRKLDDYKGRVIKKDKFKTDKILSTDKKLLYYKIKKYLQRGVNMNKDITVDDIINKFGDNPVCYLTGEQIDISKPRTYQFDHMIPVSRGGDNSLENLGICTKRANQAKQDMTPEEFIEFCKKVVEHNSINTSEKI